MAVARSGCGSPWLTKLYAGVIDDLAGEQLPVAVHKCAQRAGLPTGEAVYGRSPMNPDQLKAYDGILKTAVEAAWWRSWSAGVEAARSPIKGHKLDTKPTSISQLAAEAGLP